MSKVEKVERLKSLHHALLQELHQRIIGQDEVIHQILICLLSRGHAIIIGVPGLAKTLLINTLAETLSLKFSRIQFTPDLLPSDIIGAELIETLSGVKSFKFVKGPIFANIILADEINRTPPKTQSALLQAMQEYKITVAGQTYELEEPFFVLATQNPIEQEGTYPLPEAQIDRFMFKIEIDYPTKEEEEKVVELTTSAYNPKIQKILTAQDILELQQLVREVPVAKELIHYAVELVSLTRPSNPNSPEYIKEWVSWGASPRASQYLILGAKAKALLEGRYTIGVNDIRYVALPVLRHRIIMNFNAEAEGVKVETLIQKLVNEVK